MKKLFFSYNFNDRDDINIFFHLFSRKSFPLRQEIEIFCFDHVMHRTPWRKEIREKIADCDYFVLFLGKAVGETQKFEFNAYMDNREDGQELVSIHLSSFDYRDDERDNSNMTEILAIENDGEKCLGIIDLKIHNNNHFDAFKELIHNYLGYKEEKIGLKDDLPVFNLFSYEKDIIRHYIDKADIDKIGEKKIQSGEEYRKKYEYIKDKTQKGCPPQWPRVEEIQPKKRRKKNEIDESIVGKYRPEDAEVFSATLTSFHESCNKDGFTFTFPEAGPREKLFYPKYYESKDEKEAFKVAVLVSGGIAPGINAVIDGITQRHFMYYEAHLEKKPGDKHLKELEIWGLMNGFQAFNNFADNYVYLINNEYNRPTKEHRFIDTSKHVNEAGSILGTSRFEDLLKEPDREKKLNNIIDSLERNQIRVLYIIGGDGSMRAAHALYDLSKQNPEERNPKWNLSIVGIPKTMDNDILWAWQTFGFSSAVEKSRAIIEDLAVEVKSNPRLGIIQLFGSDSGFVVSHSVLASGTGICDLALIPEVDFSLNKILKIIKMKYSKKGHGLIVLAETAIPTDAMQFIKNRPEIIDIEYFKNDLPDSTQKYLHSYYNNKTTIYEYSSLPNDEAIFSLRKLIKKYQYHNICYLQYLTEDLFEALSEIDDPELKEILDIMKKDAKQVYLLKKDLTIIQERTLRKYIGSCKQENRFHQIDLYCLEQNVYEYIQKQLESSDKIEQEKFTNKFTWRKEKASYFFNGSLSDFLSLKSQLRAFGIYHYSDIDLSSAEQIAVIEYFKAFLENKRIEGQTNDFLRNAGLKMVEQGIKKIDPKWGANIRSLTSEPRHLLRSMPPGTIDIINGSRLGTLAVDNAMAGHSDFMISQWLTEFCMVPLKLVVLGRKRIPPSGIFWKSVIAKTGQPENLVD